MINTGTVCPPDSAKLHADLIDRVSGQSAATRRWRCIPMQVCSDGQAVADSPSRCLVVDQRGRSVGVLFLSNPTSPLLMHRAIQRSRSAREILGRHLKSVVLQPILEGEYDGLSYVMWPRHRILSSRRLLRHVQTRSIASRVLDWLRQVQSQTCAVASGHRLVEGYLDPLGRAAVDARFSEFHCCLARRGLQEIDSGTWSPRTVLEHNDFWLGNLLLPRGFPVRRTHPFGFFVIDWAGARVQGYPFLDLFRFCTSSGASLKLMRSEVAAHCRILGCGEQHVLPYLMSALIALGSKLEHFPERRYHAMCRRIVDCATRVTTSSLEGPDADRGKPDGS